MRKNLHANHTELSSNKFLRGSGNSDENEFSDTFSGNSDEAKKNKGGARKGKKEQTICKQIG